MRLLGLEIEKWEQIYKLYRFLDNQDGSLKTMWDLRSWWLNYIQPTGCPDHIQKVALELIRAYECDASTEHLTNLISSLYESLC